MYYPLQIFSLLALFVFSALTEISSFKDWPHLRVSLPDVSIHLRYYGSGPPLLLVHGYPEHSPTWNIVGPILAQNYTVIAPDLRGTGDSSIPFSYNFTASAAADDLKAVLDFLNINQTYVFAHDKGTGVAAALAAKIRGRVKRLGLSEYPLPGLGYETFQAPTPTWNLYSNWQLAFFSIPDAAQFFIQGRERQMLSWYFYHAGYAGTSAISDDQLTLYTDSISKPGYLRSGLEYFSNPTVRQDAAFFNSTLIPQPFSGPTLVLGGEASLASTSLIRQLFSPVASDLTADIVPKAGHWIADENPVWLARRISQFLQADEGIPALDLAYLDEKITLQLSVI